MKKEYIKPTAEVVVLGTDDICDGYGLNGSQNGKSYDSAEGFIPATKGTSTWEDED